MTGDNRNGGGAARAGEVIAASTGEFTAECYRSADPPPLGSLVTTRDGEIEIFGVVFHAAATGSRPLAARRRPRRGRRHGGRAARAASGAGGAAARRVLGDRGGVSGRGWCLARPTTEAGPAARVRSLGRPRGGAGLHPLASFLRQPRKRRAPGSRPRRRGLRPPRPPRPPRPRRLPTDRGEGAGAPPRPRRAAAQHAAAHDSGLRGCTPSRGLCTTWSSAGGGGLTPLPLETLAKDSAEGKNAVRWPWEREAARGLAPLYLGEESGRPIPPWSKKDRGRAMVAARTKQQGHSK